MPRRKLQQTAPKEISRAAHADSHRGPLSLWLMKLRGVPGVKIRETKAMLAYEPLAKSLYCLQKMTEACFSMLPLEQKRFYQDPDRWFALVFEERLGAGEQPIDVTITNYARRVQEEVKKLSGDRPINIYCKKTEPHSWRLLEMAIWRYTHPYDVGYEFRHQIFTPFVEAMREWKNQLQRGGVFVAVRVDERGFYYCKRSKSPKKRLDIKLCNA